MCETLKFVTENRNLTISLPETLLRRLRVCAALRNQSMTAVVKDAIERTVSENNEADKAAKRLIDRLRNSPDRGIGGKITWTRDELYER
jgi:plasmid stability protein